MLVTLLLSLVFVSVAVAWAGGWIFAQRKEYAIEPSFAIGKIGSNYFDVWLDEDLSFPLDQGLKFDFGRIEKGQNVTKEVTIYIENTFTEDILVYFVFVDLPQYMEGTVTIEGGNQVPSLVIPMGSVAKATVNLSLCSGLYSTPIIPSTPKFQINAYRGID